MGADLAHVNSLQGGADGNVLIAGSPSTSSETDCGTVDTARRARTPSR
jgi:hypothetical protein